MPLTLFYGPHEVIRKTSYTHNFKIHGRTLIDRTINQGSSNGYGFIPALKAFCAHFRIFIKF